MNWKKFTCFFKNHIWNEYPYYGTGKIKWCYRCNRIEEVKIIKKKELSYDDEVLCRQIDELLDRHDTRKRFLSKNE